jgi:pimeloyl-ACP methyl ester carboxylesterase
MNAKLFSILFFLLISTAICGQQNLRRAFQPSGVINKIPYGANTEAGHFIQATDAKIYYEVYGKGQPIVLLHGGIFGSTIEMSDFIEYLKPNFQVIAISTRGHGKSEIGTTPITYEQKATDVMTVIEAVSKEKVIVLGFSDGAYAAYKVASMYPERIKKVIAIGAGEQIPGLRKVVFNSNEILKADDAYWQQQLALMPEPKKLQEFWAKMEVFYNSMTASKELFASIKCPVLVMAGELDRNALLPTIINAYHMIPNSQLSIIPKAGHVVFLENFAAVWASILPFLEIPEPVYFPLTKELLEPYQVSAILTKMGDEKVVQVIKDPSIKLVDEPTFVKIKGTNFSDGEIEVKVLSKLLPTASTLARGFIGIAFRINESNSKFESIYIRPTNGRAEEQIRRNHSIQYFSYPDYKFDRLRKESPEVYESYGDMELNTWIRLKIIVKGATAKLYLNDNAEPSLIVNDLKKGNNSVGSVGLWVDVGTEGYFKDLKITTY